MCEETLDEIRDIVANYAIETNKYLYGDLLVELLAEAVGWKIQLDELRNCGEYESVREWPEEPDYYA
jgi:hypothetical protein